MTDIVEALQDDMRALRIELQAQGINNARISERLNALQKHVDAMTAGFVTIKEFEPIKRFVYGVAGLLVAGVVTALLAVVIQGGGVP